MREAVERIDTAVHVEIPEGVRLTFFLAGPAARLGAYLVDAGLRAVLLIVLMIAVLMVFPLLRGGASWGILLLALFFLEWGYSFAFEALWNGQTPGKRAFGLRVVRERGQAIEPYDALVRNLLRAADALPALYGVGFLSMLATERLQRLGDLAAGTMVVHERRRRLKNEPPDLGGATPFEAAQTDLAFRPTERTLDLIHAFALRQGELPLVRAREIASILAEPLARRVGWRARPEPPERFLLRAFRTFHERRR